MSGSELLDSLRAAVDAAPADTALRLHLAELRIQAGEHEEARRHLGHVLALDPKSERALELLTASGQPAPGQEPSAHDESVDDAIDWDQLDRDFDEVVEPMFVEGRSEDATADAWEVTREPITLADVSGLAPVKERLELAFLAPLRNPELRRLYGKSLRGGLVLYGPPGCGKSFIARALAGELAAGFLSISITDVLNMYVGQSEANLHELFMQARRNAPCVLFFDEIDALGRRRAHLSSDVLRTTVNQLLLELDGVEHENEGMFVLAATNHFGTSTPHFAGRAASTGCCSCSLPTSTRERRSSARTCATARWPASTSVASPGGPTDTRAPTASTCVTARPRKRWSIPRERATCA